MTYLRTVVIDTVALLGSLGTLLCCALPALLVSIGAGASLATIVTAIPQLVWISEHKLLVFLSTGAMLVFAGATTYLNRHAPCPTEPVQARSCRRVRSWSTAIFAGSVMVYVVGFYFAFIAGR